MDVSEWEPATDAERAMRDALRTDDQESYFRILAGIGWAGTYMTGLKLLADQVDAARRRLALDALRGRPDGASPSATSRRRDRTHGSTTCHRRSLRASS